MVLNLNKNTDTMPLMYHDKCDVYDYLISVTCGAIAGIVDIFLVGTPNSSVIGTWTDTQVDNCVKGFAKKCGWKGYTPKGDVSKLTETDISNRTMSSAISFLEKKFKVNYDQKSSTDVAGLFNMGTKNHHFKSLAHSPDIIGLFFSILNQFTSTSSFIADGKLVTINTESFELRGNNFISKLFCGVANWIGHIMSDISGSSGGRGNGTGRGSGVAIPFFELLGFINNGKFKIGDDKQSFSLLATRVFQEGYDFRFGVTMAIPVFLCELVIKLIWAIKHFKKCNKPLKECWKECIPLDNHDDLRVMLLFGNGTLCIIDTAEAVICCGGNWLTFFTHLNIIAWYRFVMLVLKEVCIRTGIALPLQKEIDAYIKVNNILTNYIQQLENLDIELFKKETAEYNAITAIIENSNSEDSLNTSLYNAFKSLGIDIPWNGTFNDFMNDSKAVMVFK